MASGRGEAGWCKTAQPDGCGKLDGADPISASKFIVFPKISDLIAIHK